MLCCRMLVDFASAPSKTPIIQGSEFFNHLNELKKKVSFLGMFQSPVDSFSEPPGGSRMVIENRIVMIRHHPTANQRLYNEVSQTPRLRSAYPYRNGQARLAPSRHLRQNDADCSGLSHLQNLSVSAHVGGSAPTRNTLERAHIPRPRPAVAIGAVDVVVTLGSRLFDSESLLDSQAPRVPAELRGLSQRLPPSLWTRRPFHPLDATADRGVLSQR